MNILKKVICLILIVFSIASIANSNGFDLRSLENSIKHGNTEEAIKQINLSKHEQYRKEVSSYILSLWEQRSSSEYSVLKNSLVLINLADFLSQAHKNGFIKIDESPVLDLAHSSLGSNDEQVVSQSLNILSRSSAEEDVGTIFSFIQDAKSEYLFNVSVMAVLSQCDKLLNQELHDLKKLSNKKKKYIKDSYNDFKAAGLCADI